MQKIYDVIALGEILIDFVISDISTPGTLLYECNPGGAPANVLIAVARQGSKTAFIGKVGKDPFGKLLKKTLENNDVCAKGLCIDNECHTTVAFVSLDDTGNRSFSFVRNPGADHMLTIQDIDESLIKASRIFHFGSVSLSKEPGRNATKHALNIAKENSLVISYDPNLRPLLWDSQETARKQIISCLKYVDILKVSNEEFSFITGESDYEKHAPGFADKYGITHLFITLGKEGSYFYHKGISGTLPAYDVIVVDTTGAGDSFFGAVLSQLITLPDILQNLNEAKLREIVAFANASGSIACGKKGAIPAIPTKLQIIDCLNNATLARSEKSDF